MAYDLAWELHGVHNRLSGYVSDEELVESVCAIHRHPRFHEVRFVINDLSDVASHAFGEELMIGLEALLYGAHETNPRCRIFFVTQDEALAALIRRHLVDGHLASYEVVTLGTLAQARLWLETQPCTFRLSHKYGYRDFLVR